MPNKPIHELLNMPKEDYQNMTLSSFLDWAGIHSLNHSHWASVIASPAINRWFLREYGKLEGKFLQMIEEYCKDTNQDLMIDVHRVYNECVAGIDCVYPKALLDQARPKAAIKPQFTNRVSTQGGRHLIAYKGIQIN